MDKTTAQRLVRETFKAAFDKKRYRDFINELCNGFDEGKAQNMGVPDAFTPHVKSCQRLGTFESADGELADVLIVHLTESYKLERTRTALRDFVAHKLKREPVVQTLWKTGGLLAGKIKQAIVRHGLEKIVSLHGLAPWTLLAFADSGSTAKEAIKTLFMKEMLAQGILIAASNNVTYAHSDDDVARIAAAYYNAFARIAAELKSGTLLKNLGCSPVMPVFSVRPVSA